MATSRFQVIRGGGEAMGMGLADFFWISSSGMEFKKKTILVGKDEKGEPVPLIQRWSFVAEDHPLGCPSERGAKCTCTQPFVTRILAPCFFLPDPTRPQPNYLVLCEVRDTADKCVPYNYRTALRQAMSTRGPASKLVWFGFEQDYTLFNVDAEDPNLMERQFLTSERHLGACFDAGLLIHSSWNAPGYDIWEFKVGYRGFPQDLDPDPPSALTVCDHLMVAHYLMQKIGAEKGLVPEWEALTLFVSTPELRESGDSKTQAVLLMNSLADGERKLRVLPHPVHGGCQCIEVALTKFSDPYKMALDVLEAVWPLDTTSDLG